MTPKIRNKAVLYLRVSTDEQARDAYGLESQENKCRQFCIERDWDVVAVFTDPGVSGWADVERPGFVRMVAYVRQHRDVNLVFQDYSRFGRNTFKALKALVDLDRYCYSIAADSPGIDCRTAQGRTARREELSKAEDFSDRNSEKTSERMKVAFEDGRHCRIANIGYRNIPKKLQVKGGANIEPEPMEAQLVAKAFKLVEDGNNTAAEVLRIVSAMGLRSKKGNPLTLHTFLKMLRNPIYVGLLKSKKWGKTVQGKHQPIIDERTFRNVQLILKGKRPVAAPYKRNNPDFPLRRFLKCGSCRTPLTAAPAKSETGRKYGYYWCYKCHAVKTTPSAQVESQFLELLEQLRPDEQMMNEFPKVLEQEWKSRTADNSAITRKLQSELKEKRLMQEKLVVAYLKGDKNIAPVYEQMSQKFQDDIEQLKSEIADADAVTATFEQLWDFSRNLLVDIASAWKLANIDQKQRVQNILFPHGLNYDSGKGILNSDYDCLFLQLKGFMAGKVSLARPERFELPT